MKPQTIPIHTLDGRYLGCIVNELPALFEAKAGGRAPLSRALRTGATAEPQAPFNTAELMRNDHHRASRLSNLPHAEPYGRKGQHDHGA